MYIYIYIYTEMLETVLHQQDTKSLLQELNGLWKTNPETIRRCSVPTVFLHRPEPPQPDHCKEWLTDTGFGVGKSSATSSI